MNVPRTLSNVGHISRREFSVRVRTRGFLIGTLLLIVGVAAIALLPVILSYIDRSETQRVAVHVAAPDLTVDPVVTIAAILNPIGGSGGTDDGAEEFTVEHVADLETARGAVVAGTYVALLDITRGADGDLDFTLYSNRTSGQLVALAQQAASSVAISDRLGRLGIDPAGQAGLFEPVAFGVAWADDENLDPIDDESATVGQDILAFGMTVLIFMIILLYGNWIAMSVVEEKQSRVMEVVLNAATPFELLTGKVFGVGAVALTQYGAIVVTGVAALLLQGTIANALLGDAAAGGLPPGLDIGLLVAFGIYGLLGFLIYAVLYAAAGSLVSRQEDVNSVVMPMNLISTLGYLVAVYSSIGLIDPRATWVGILAQVPFLSPFMMLGRITAGLATPLEVALSILLLVLAILGALWVASRIYAAGVLLYGQRPGIRAILRLVRSGT